MKYSIDNIDFKDKKVLIRVDFNVPLDKDCSITDDTRIKAALPTITKVIEKGGKVILMSHLGRPKGKVIPEMSLKPVSVRLGELLNTKVLMADDCIGNKVLQQIDSLKSGEVLLLENLRFHKEEEANDEKFASELAKNGEIYINDAFGSAHRAHASVAGICKFMDVCIFGYLMEKEIKFLGNLIVEPERPFVAILGGAKISGKIELINNLLDKVDSILIGGGMAATFFKAQGKEIGDSLCEEDKVSIAKSILEKVEKENRKLLLPVDGIIVDSFDNNAMKKVVSVDEIEPGWRFMDIGEDTVKIFKEEIAKAKTVFWNGPMGVFEMDNFAKGTSAIGYALAEVTEKGATTVIGGGDSAAAIAKLGLKSKVTHVSTGGGASLEFLEGKSLPGIEAIKSKY